MLEAEVLPHAKEAEVPSVPNKSQAGSEEKKTKRRSSSLGKNLKQKWEKKVGCRGAFVFSFRDREELTHAPFPFLFFSSQTDDCTTSRYRGVTKHRRSGRWESHIWLKETGRQMYLGEQSI